MYNLGIVGFNMSFPSIKTVAIEETIQTWATARQEREVTCLYSLLPILTSSPCPSNTKTRSNYVLSNLILNKSPCLSNSASLCDPTPALLLAQVQVDPEGRRLGYQQHCCHQYQPLPILNLPQSLPWSLAPLPILPSPILSYLHD